MKKLMEKIGVQLRHNPAVAIALVVVVVMVVWLQGCEPMVASLIDPARKVTRSEMRLEVSQTAAAIQAKAEAELATLKLGAESAEKKLDQIDAIRQQVAEIGLAVAQGGTINPVGVVMTAMGILGVGAVVDNRKKDGLLQPNPAKKKT